MSTKKPQTDDESHQLEVLSGPKNDFKDTDTGEGNSAQVGEILPLESFAIPVRNFLYSFSEIFMTT